MRDCDQTVGQHSGGELAAARGQMPGVQDADFLDLSGGGAADRSAVLELLLCLRADDRGAEVGGLFGATDRADLHRHARTDIAGRRELFGVCRGPDAEPGDEAFRRQRALDREPDLRLPASGTGALAGRRPVGSGIRKRAAVAGRGGILPAARARRDGPGRRENDADGGIFSGAGANVVDDSGGIGAGKRSRAGFYDGQAQGIGLRATVRAVSGNGGGASDVFWNSPAYLVSLAG